MATLVICVFRCSYCLKRGSGGARWPASHLKFLTGQGFHGAPQVSHLPVSIQTMVSGVARPSAIHDTSHGIFLERVLLGPAFLKREL